MLLQWDQRGLSHGARKIRLSARPRQYYPSRVTFPFLYCEQRRFGVLYLLYRTNFFASDFLLLPTPVVLGVRLVEDSVWW
jgi:hypothetical protein